MQQAKVLSELTAESRWKDNYPFAPRRIRERNGWHTIYYYVTNENVTKNRIILITQFDAAYIFLMTIL